VAGIYSVQLGWAEYSGGPAVTLVPADDVNTLVVRNMFATFVGTSQRIGFAAGFAVRSDITGIAVWQIWPPLAVANFTFQWEGHHVLVPGESLLLDPLDANWTAVVSGYRLTP
jgi:hypothetical protein